MPAVDKDSNGKLGLTWLESPNSEYLTMWFATIDPAGNLVAAIVAAGASFFFANGWISDSNATVLDQSDDRKDVFWSASEYIGYDGSINIWRIRITSFTTGKQRIYRASYSAQ